MHPTRCFIAAVAAHIGCLAILGACADGTRSTPAIVGSPSPTEPTVPAPPASVASVTVSPPSSFVIQSQLQWLTATAWDSVGRVLAQQRRFAWTTSDSAVAVVDSAGVVHAIAPGSARISASVAGRSGTAIVVVLSTQPVRFLPDGVRAGINTCGLATNGQAYCWGIIGPGSPSDGTLIATETPVPVAAGLAFSTIAVGGDEEPFGFAADDWDYSIHVCGLAGSTAYCWGTGLSGQLGNGTTGQSSPSPVAVAGGHAFTTLSAGGEYTCGLDPTGSAYCWGDNHEAQLGNGGSGTGVSVPGATAGGLSFVALSAGFIHACALTQSGTAYCWGDGEYGQLGNAKQSPGTQQASSLQPSAVMGGLTFATISAGDSFTCGVTLDGAAYCWGDGRQGNLGNGAFAVSSIPVAVVGGLRFTTVSAGTSHACGLTTGGAAYCWGSNLTGGLGVSGPNSAVPVAVTGGLTFTAISAGSLHTCGIAISGATYCWGSNAFGEIGDGTTTTRATPTKVLGQP